MNRQIIRYLLPGATAVAAAVALAIFFARPAGETLKERLPGADQPSGADTAIVNPGAAGTATTIERPAMPAAPVIQPGAWPWFRGPNRDGIAPETGLLARSWGQGGPRQLWSVAVGEGYGGPAVLNGCVYLIDFDRDKRESQLRCLSLDDGKDLWRYAYPLSVKRNHGMTRTVPSVTDKFVVAMDPKCNVICVNAADGQLRWALNLVHDCGTTIPPWYAGQCPLIDGSSVILAPGGPDALLMSVELETGKPIWKTPNPRGWKMTHSSLAIVQFGGRKIYLYCGSGGVAGVAAESGELLFDTTDWKISLATVPTPVPMENGKVFLSGGYNAGSLMLQLRQEGPKISTKTLFKLGPEVFGATQQTAVYRDGLIFGIRPDGQFACIDVNGKPVWASGSGTQFGLGPLLMAGDLIFAMNDSGRLTMMEASRSKFVSLGQAQVFKEGHEAWSPMALAGTRLLVRDFTRLMCLEVGGK